MPLCLKKNEKVMKRLLSIYSLLLGAVVFAQNSEQKKQILANTNVDALKALYKDFKVKDSLTDARIEKFLLDNPQIERRKEVEGSIYEIVDIVDNNPVYTTNDNSLAAISTRTVNLHPGGSLGLSLEGAGMLIGVWDGAKAHFQHQEFQDDATPSVSRVATPDTPFPAATSNAHATHVTGTILAKGVQAAAKGMAPKANGVSYNWTNDEAEVVNEITTNGLLLSNHSYGIPVLDDNGAQNAPTWLMGCYNSDARAWDQILYNAPYYLQVTSAGNSGQDSYTGGTQGAFDKLTADKNAKNNLVVANANPSVNSSTDALTLAINPSSSQGPSDDGRIKPDISGDGTNLYSPINTNTTAYDTYSGTSMASPNVAGSLLLLQQYYSQLKSVFMRSATLKALATHTAVDGGTTGPDARFGWGLLDSRAAVLLLQNAEGLTPTAVVSELTLSQNQTYTVDVTVNNVQKLQATICWTDPAGVAMDNQSNSTTPALVNDLDLRIIKGTEVNMPWKINFSNFGFPSLKGDNIVDNVERVEVDNASGTYTIQVTHKGTLSNGPQAYSLIISGFDIVSLSNQLFDEKSMTIYPIPASNVLNVSTDNEIVENYSIIDAQGRIVKQSKVDFDKYLSIDVSDLSAGIYYLKVEGDNKSITKKFIKN